MKLFSLRLTTLKRKLYAIVFVSFVVRVVAFFALPDSRSLFAPDEGNYGSLTEWIAQGKPADEYSYGILYISSRSLILPATALYHLGLSGLDSVRVISAMYGFLTIALTAYFLLYCANQNQNLSNYILSNQTSVLSLFSIFAFLPSSFMWSIFGLRESTVAFWVFVVFISIFYIFETKEKLSKFVLVSITISIPLVFSSRPQVGLAVAVSLLIYCAMRIRVREARNLIPIVLIGIFLGQTLSSNPATVAEIEFTAYKEVNESRSLTKADFNISLLCTSENQKLKNNGDSYICLEKKNSFSTLASTNIATLTNTATNIPEKLSIHQKLNKIGASSAIEKIDCAVNEKNKLDEFFCLFYRSPFTTFTFLFRPLPGADVTSDSSLYAAIENLLWLTAFVFILIMFIRNRRLAFLSAISPSLIFVCVYSVGAGAYEGNMGTAFRHKSLILWVVILLLASSIVATQQRKAEQQGISGTSQE